MEAEQALLGAVLFDNEAYHRVIAMEARDFAEPFHGRLWEAMERLIQRGRGAEPIVLIDQFRDDPAFKDLGGLGYLADLVDRAPPGSSAPTYAEQVKELAIRRGLVRIAGDMIDRANSDHETPGADQIVETEAELYRLAEVRSGAAGGFVTFESVVHGAVGMAEEAFARDGGLVGLSTGLIDLDQKLGGLHPSDLLILAGRPSMGKAQGLDAKVLMADGSWRRMGDLRLGDRLASVDGAPSRVAGIFPQGERQTYRVTLSDGRSTTACGDHLWRVESAKFSSGARTLATDQLREMLTKERYQRRMSLPLVSGHFGEDRDLPIDAWLLGAMLGNGCMSSGHLSISTPDAATLFRVQKVVGHDCVRAVNDYDYRITMGENGLRDGLRTLGLWGLTSPDKFIPPAYLRASRQTRLELLRGLLDTDGWVETFGAVRIALSSRQLAEDVRDLVRSLGGVCRISQKRPKFTHRGEVREGLTSYVCNLSHPDRASLISLRRKQRRCEREIRFRAPTIISITPEKVEPVQCIRVTHPSSLYVTDDYVVTHNTALATNIAFHVARDGAPVGFFSLEMSGEQLALRILSEVSGVSGDKIRKGQTDATEIARIRDAGEEIARTPLFVDATGGLPIAKLTARARRLKRLHGLRLIVVDYLQLVTVSAKPGANRVNEVSEVTMGLKALAKELGVPVIALSQLSRQVESRDDKRPQLSDLRESGSIEQDADAVMFVYREAYYLGRAEPREGSPEHLEWQEQMDKLRNEAEVIIGKQRHGPIGTVRLSFNDDTTKFGNLGRPNHFAAAAPLNPRYSFGAPE
jgi:replicative DNA helicase